MLKGPFNPKYVGDYRIVYLKGNQVEVQPANGGPTEMKHIKHVKYGLPIDRYIEQLPNYSMFGRKTTLRMNPEQIPDLHWKLANTYHTTSIGYTETLNTTISVNHIDVKTLGCAGDGRCEEWCGITLNTNMSTSSSNQEPTVFSIIPIT